MPDLPQGERRGGNIEKGPESWGEESLATRPSRLLRCLFDHRSTPAATIGLSGSQREALRYRSTPIGARCDGRRVIESFICNKGCGPRFNAGHASLVAVAAVVAAKRIWCGDDRVMGRGSGNQNAIGPPKLSPCPEHVRSSFSASLSVTTKGILVFRTG